MSIEAYIAFSRSPGILGDAIAGAEILGDGRTKLTPPSHALIIYRDSELGRWSVVDSEFAGVSTRPFAALTSDGTRILRMYRLCGFDLWQGVLACQDDLGRTGYDFLGLAGQMIRVGFWALLKLKIKVWNNPRRYYCSEWIAARVLPAISFPLFGYQPTEMDPQQLEEALVMSCQVESVPATLVQSTTPNAA